jgi:hypothetical protein
MTVACRFIASQLDAIVVQSNKNFKKGDFLTPSWTAR